MAKSSNLKYKQLIKENFSRQSAIYERYANIQRITLYKLLDFIQDHHIDLSHSQYILDIGSGSGPLKSILETTQSIKTENIIELDISFSMCKTSKIKNKNSLQINADMHHIPLKENIIDVVFSSFSLHWSNDIHQIFSSVKKIVNKNNNYIFIAIPLENSLKELRTSFKQFNEEDRIHKFLSLENFTKIIKLSNLEIIDSKVENISQKSSGLKDMLLQLKSIGGNIGSRKYFSKTTLEQISQFYKSTYSFNNIINNNWEMGFFILKTRYSDF